MQIETGSHIILNWGLFQPIFVEKATLAPFTHQAGDIITQRVKLATVAAAWNHGLLFIVNMTFLL